MQTPKTILITGAASGIGKATATYFVKHGWQVAAVDVNPGALSQLTRELGPSLWPVVGDVRSRDGAQALVKQVTDRTSGRLDCLFNCAGTLEMQPHVEIAPDKVDRMIDVNVRGVLYCIDAAFPALAATPGAHVINMSSTASEYGTPDHAVYSASKFFVRGLTEALNIEFERHGIQVSAILVAYVQTPMVLQATNQAHAVQSVGVKVKAETVAAKVWQAAHGNRVLWRIGADACLLNIVVRLLGSGVRVIYKKLSGY